MYFRSSTLIIIPFQLVQFCGLLLVFSNSKEGKRKWLENLKQFAKKFIKKFNLLFFVAEMYQIWYLDAAKIFFGSALQFLFQLWILRAAMYYGDAKLSQYLSVLSDIFNIRKGLKLVFLFYQPIWSFIIYFKKIIPFSSKISIKLLTLSNDADDGEDKSFWENVKGFFIAVWHFIMWLPLVLSSVIYKIGSMLLYYVFLESLSYAFLMIALIFVGNFLTCFLLKYVSIPSPAKFDVYILNKAEDDDDEENTKVYKDLPFREKVFVSYSNIFVFSGPVKEANSR